MDDRGCGGSGVGGVMLAHMVPDLDMMPVLRAGGAKQVNTHFDIPVGLTDIAFAHGQRKLLVCLQGQQVTKP